jgi:hypothetical protein
MRTLLFVLFLAACSKVEHPPVLDNSGTYPGGGGVKVLGDGGVQGDGGAFGVLASITSPTGIALDATYAYMTATTGDLLRVPRLGGSVDAIANGVNLPGQLILARGGLFFLSAGTIGTMALPQSAVSTFASDAISPNAIAATTTDVYWLELQQLGTTAVELATRPIGGGNKRIVATSTGHLDPGPLLISNGYAYFGYSDTANGLIYRTLLTAGGDNAESFAQSPDGQVVDLATDGVNLYFAVSNPLNGGKIESTPLSAGGAVTTLVTDAGGPRHLAVKGSFVYFTAGAAGELRAVPTTGGDVVVIASNMDAPSWVVVDDASYVTYGAGLARLPR